MLWLYCNAHLLRGGFGCVLFGCVLWEVFRVAQFPTGFSSCLRLCAMCAMCAYPGCYPYVVLIYGNFSSFSLCPVLAQFLSTFVLVVC